MTVRRQLLVMTALALALGVAPAAAQCPNKHARVRSEGPAATLLYPYFEVDLDGSRTTLLAIANKVNVGDGRSALAHTLARVTLWTDWAIPTMSFDLYLRPGEVRTVNLRDIFRTGDAPLTHPPAGVFTSCGPTLGGDVIHPQLLVERHTGRPSATFCYSQPRSDTSLATGYVTVDVTQRCGASSRNPTQVAFWQGTTRMSSNENRLWGDLIFVDPTQNFASGQAAVAVVADPAAFDPGEYTFYGRYVNFDASDERRPLNSYWGSRYLTGGGFDGGTDLLVWRDTRNATAVAPSCGAAPAWFPLTEIFGPEFFAEDGRRHSTGLGTQFFELATQRVAVSDMEPPYPFGWLRILLSINRSEHRSQGWVGWIASAEDRFSAGLAGTPLLDCTFDP